MTFDWTQYLILAQDQAGTGTRSPNEEARLRDAISRSYYAAFCKARNHLRDTDNLTIPLLDVHAFIRDAFLNSADREHQRIGNDLGRIAINRKKADYEDEMPGKIRETTEFNLRIAHRIIRKLASLP